MPRSPQIFGRRLKIATIFEPHPRSLPLTHLAPNIATKPEHYTISATFCAHRLDITTIRYPPTQYHHIEKYLLGLATSARTMSRYRHIFGVRLNIATIRHPPTQYRHNLPPPYPISPHSKIPTRISHLCQAHVSISPLFWGTSQYHHNIWPLLPNIATFKNTYPDSPLLPGPCLNIATYLGGRLNITTYPVLPLNINQSGHSTTQIRYKRGCPLRITHILHPPLICMRQDGAQTRHIRRPQ